MEVDQRSFTPLVFTVNGGMKGESRVFYSKLALLISPYYELCYYVYMDPVQLPQKIKKVYTYI